jgi:hypothetical protein
MDKSQWFLSSEENTIVTHLPTPICKKCIPVSVANKALSYDYAYRLTCAKLGSAVVSGSGGTGGF